MRAALQRGDALLFPINRDPNLLTHAAGCGAGHKCSHQASPPTPCSAASPQPAAPAAGHAPKAGGEPPAAHQRGKAGAAPAPRCSPQPCLARKQPRAQRTPPASGMHGFFFFFLREDAVCNIPPPPPNPAEKQVTLAGGLQRGASRTTSVPDPAAQHLCLARRVPGDGRGFSGLGCGEGAPGQGGGFSPAWVLSPGSRVHARGPRRHLPSARSKLRPVRNKVGCGSRASGLILKDFVCMERTWCWCGFWWWWLGFFERPGYLQVTYTIRAALSPSPIWLEPGWGETARKCYGWWISAEEVGGQKNFPLNRRRRLLALPLRGRAVGCVTHRGLCHARSPQRAEPRAAEEQVSAGTPSGRAKLPLEQAAPSAPLPPGEARSRGSAPAPHSTALPVRAPVDPCSPLLSVGPCRCGASALLEAGNPHHSQQQFPLSRARLGPGTSEMPS